MRLPGLDIFNNLGPDEKPNYGGVTRQLSTSDKDPDPEFFEELMIDSDANIWDIWTEIGSAYFQYSKRIIKVIDKIALKTKDVPAQLFYVGGGSKTFNDWFKNNSNQNFKF